MREQYYVTLHSQMGPRTGVLTLQYQGENVTGSLYLLACHNFVRGVQTRDGKLHLFHSIQTAISSFPCETVLELQNGRLTGLTAARPCRIHWEGTQIQADAFPSSQKEKACEQ